MHKEVALVRFQDVEVLSIGRKSGGREWYAHHDAAECGTRRTMLMPSSKDAC